MTVTTPVSLTIDWNKLTIKQRIERTLNYIQSPQQYLINLHGESHYNTYKHLYCLPSENIQYQQCDMYGNGGHKQIFEQHIAAILGKQYSVFMLTGVQIQTIICKLYCIHAQQSIVAWHYMSHLEQHEKNAYSELYGLQRMYLNINPAILPTVTDIQQIVTLPVHERPAVIVLELPNRELGCVTYTYNDLQQISKLCHENNVALHCDGARLWEIEPYYNTTDNISFIELCDLFDSVYVSFYKGLQGAVGGMLLSNNKQLIDDSLIWQRRAGGNTITMYYDTIDCERGYNENIGTFQLKYNKMKFIAADVLHATKQYTLNTGHCIVEFIPVVPTCSQCLIQYYGATVSQLMNIRDRIEQTTGIQLFQHVRPYKNTDSATDDTNTTVSVCQQELMIYSGNVNIDNKYYVEAYTILCQEILKLQ